MANEARKVTIPWNKEMARICKICNTFPLDPGKEMGSIKVDGGKDPRGVAMRGDQRLNVIVRVMTEITQT